jgi:hypothetical protein
VPENNVIRIIIIPITPANKGINNIHKNKKNGI